LSSILDTAGDDPLNEDGAHRKKKYTLLLAQELFDQLNRAGFQGFRLTRTTDTLIDLLPIRPTSPRRAPRGYVHQPALEQRSNRQKPFPGEGSC